VLAALPEPPDAGADDKKTTVFDRISTRLKNNPVIAVLLLAFIVLGALIAFADSLAKLKSVVFEPTVVEAQEAWWNPADPKNPVVSLIGRGSKKSAVVPWSSLKGEIETRLLPQVQRVPRNSTVGLRDADGQANKIIAVVSPTRDEIAHVWFGFDPKKNWLADGLVRVGVSGTGSDRDSATTVWETFERYSDGSYRRR
jgi:hypothetical protein